MSSLFNQLTGQALTTAAQVAVATPVVRQNRARAAVVVHEGYDWLETWDRWRPTVFALSAAGAAVSWSIAYRRRKLPEAVALYCLTGTAASVLAWFTRPAALRPPPAALPVPAPGTVPLPGQTAPPPPGALAQLLGYLDRRATALSGERPGWEGAALRRLARDLGAGILEPYAEVLLTGNTR